MSIQKVSDLEQLNYGKNTQSGQLGSNLKNSLIEISYLLSSDDYNHKWYKSMAMSYDDMLSSAADYITNYLDPGNTFDKGIKISGDVLVNELDTETEMRNHGYKGRLKFNTFGLSANNLTAFADEIHLSTRHSSIDMDQYGNIIIRGNLNLPVTLSIGGVSLSDYVINIMNSDQTKILIKTETP